MATALSLHPTPTTRERPISLVTVESIPSEVVAPRRLHHHMLVLEPTSLLTPESIRAFRAANYLVRPVRSWHQAIEWVEQEELDAILLDLDAIDNGVSRLNVSSARLITLLRRSAGDRCPAIAAVSRRDIAELEDTMAAGVDIFVNRRASLLCMIQRIDATRQRLTQRIHELAG
jgi:DNA-binding NarL/FixJ family response regulator